MKNTGECDGDEVVQVYLRRVADIEGPAKSLRAFRRISLKAGESRTVSIDLPKKQFETWDSETNTMRVLSGEYEIMVGNSSRNEDLLTIKTRIE